ncbi:unnamed protein product [Caenorhabditis sp. 36 PRJEB53466]|nr:unnamed protein product [Caenorhabditis sp. 36 PRJEB53466]
MMSVILLALLLQGSLSFAPNFNCSKSALCQQEIENFRIQEIKDSILQQLHMSVPPPNGTIPSAKLREKYRSMYYDMDDSNLEEKETETTMTLAQDPSNGEDRSQLIASFPTPGTLHNEITEAKLIFQINLQPDRVVQDVHIQVFTKTDDGYLGELIISDTQSISGSERISVSIPIDAVQRWYTSSPIKGLFVSAMVNGHNVAIHPQQTEDDFENMILQVTTVKGERRSRRLATPICTKEKPSDGCCLYDLMIDFEKIGWEWIIAPPRYNAYLCRGNCKLNSHHYALSENGHTKIMKAAYRMGDDVKSQVENLGFCCHPTEYEFIKLIYVNRDGRVSVANVNGMIARKCACS